MDYVPYHRLGDRPNIIVDGRAMRSTRLTLSHWPGNDTPEPLKDDLSAQIVFRYLEEPAAYVNTDEIEAVSNNHFDEDGLVGLYSILHPEEAQELKDSLIGIASTGDFGVCHDRDAIRSAFIISAWTDPATSPLKSSLFLKPYAEITAILYEELIPRLSKIVTKVDYLEKYWKKPDKELDEAERAIKQGDIELEEHQELDLLIAKTGGNKTCKTSYEKREGEGAIRLDSGSSPHQIALHNASNCSRVLIMNDSDYDFYYRYESWVEFRSKSIPPRVDLADAAALLNRYEKDAAVWEADSIDEIVPHLRLKGGKSKISQADMRTYLIDFLGGRKEKSIRNPQRPQ